MSRNEANTRKDLIDRALEEVERSAAIAQTDCSQSTTTIICEQMLNGEKRHQTANNDMIVRKTTLICEPRHLICERCRLTNYLSS